MFDPFGIIGPVIVTGKIFMQKLWMAKLTWNENLKGSFLSEWLEFMNSLSSLKFLKIPRFLFSKEKIVHIQLHGFADSSMKAYAACVYIRTVCSDNSIFYNLMTSKSRVAPIKTVTLPRLEL
ncbi:hypothetical protein JTB14_026200 [Gonioctena quinquepunctata]|nr:hypothetical protein JTB14_026200 [Gonioctena quinquepunctata]